MFLVIFQFSSLLREFFLRRIIFLCYQVFPGTYPLSFKKIDRNLKVPSRVAVLTLLNELTTVAKQSIGIADSLLAIFKTASTFISIYYLLSLPPRDRAIEI